jgi:hypothetical protein
VFGSNSSAQDPTDLITKDKITFGLFPYVDQLTSAIKAYKDDAENCTNIRIPKEDDIVELAFDNYQKLVVYRKQ